jgi:membrane protease subunit HflK
MYLDTMQQVYSNVTKVIIDSRQGSNLLYLPLDKIMQSVAQQPAALSQDGSASSGAGMAAGTVPVLPGAVSNDSRSRDFSRSRDRESR